MKKVLLLMLLAVCIMFAGNAIASDDGIAYSTTVAVTDIGTNCGVDISTSYAKIRISRITITCTADEFNTQSVTFFDSLSGLHHTSTASARPIYKVDFGTQSTSNTSPRIIQENYTDGMPLVAKNGLQIVKSSANSTVKVSILYR